MHAMVLPAPGAPLRFESREDPTPGPGDVRVRVSACGVCRTDLHVVDGELPEIAYPIVPGHEVVGRVDALGAGVMNPKIGERVGVPWLGYTCGECSYCRGGQENLCDRPRFTGYTRDGGFATHLVADARYCFPLGEAGDDVAIAPLLCAGLIGWRSLVMAGDGKHLGIFGFGAAGHIVAQVAAARSMHSHARAMSRRRISRNRWAPNGAEPRKSSRRFRSMRPSSMRRSALSFRWRFAPCVRADGWSVPAFTCPTSLRSPTRSSGGSGSCYRSPT